jgi:hypothetical protein
MRGFQFGELGLETCDKKLYIISNRIQVGSIGWALEAELMDDLDQVSHAKLPYPYDFIATARR